ncbi:unannotated protein [freshwater metagenome]|uniref:Unannotated protein n=1 Tax=freshwater metagenome TaxID=449393 RepID=A0A6J7I697_9ZZZZ
MLDERTWKAINTGRHRCVRGENRPSTSHLYGLFQRESQTDELTDPLKSKESGMAFVGVEHLRSRMARDLAVRPNGTNTTDPKQHLLLESMIRGSSVQTISDLALRGAIEFDFGIQQQQRHPANLRDPDMRMQNASAGESNSNDRGGAIAIPEQGHRHTVGI